MHSFTHISRACGATIYDENSVAPGNMAWNIVHSMIKVQNTQKNIYIKFGVVKIKKKIKQGAVHPQQRCQEFNCLLFFFPWFSIVLEGSDVGGLWV